MLPKEKHSMLGSERGVAPILNWENTPFVIQICIFKNPREFSNVIYNCLKKKIRIQKSEIRCLFKQHAMQSTPFI